MPSHGTILCGPVFDWGFGRKAMGHVVRPDGTVNWRAAACADPGVVRCGGCGAYLWNEAPALRCECGYTIGTITKGGVMPHYRNGEEAKVGDHVRGTGYNVKNADGTPAVITGVVTNILPGTTTCNLQIEHAIPNHKAAQVARLDTEYGQADQFEKIR